MGFKTALEISGKFQEAYETLKRLEGENFEKKAKPYMDFIKDVMNREKCSCCEACLILLKNWHKSVTIPTTALTMWLLASAIIIEKKELENIPLFNSKKAPAASERDHL